LRARAAFAAAEILRKNLHDLPAAQEAYSDLLKKYPQSPYARQAKARLRDLKTEMKQSPKNNVKSGSESAMVGSEMAKQIPPNKTKSNLDSNAAFPVESSSPEGKKASSPTTKTEGSMLIQDIRYWSTPNYTRVVVILSGEASYSVGTTENPDRVYIDLAGSQLAPALDKQVFELSHGHLKKIRGRNQSNNSTRIVLEGEKIEGYRVSTLQKPFRILIDVQGELKENAAQSNTRNISSRRGKSISDEKENLGPMIVKSQVPSDSMGENNLAKAEVVEKKSSAPEDGREKAVTPADIKTDTPSRGNGGHGTSPSKKEDSVPKTAAQNEKSAPSSIPQEASEMTPLGGKPSNAPRKTAPTEAPRKSQSSDELIAENSHVSSPKSDGTRSLIRTLGLKIGKIVIDPGHGGHDTGTIGPSGLREKDLVLDIAKKLKKLIEEKIGGEVVLTRENDTFIPLENRTEIANQHQADLFISIHANSSHNKKVRGVETFFLNFATSADVEEVAARENATSQKTIFELQDLIQKIALKEKVEESKEFAQTIQKAMSGTLLKSQPQARNRGVKQAPFIVLIGANMPSILSEVSFVSNPADEKLLRSTSYRQKIAEALLSGINNYSQTLSGIKTARNLNESGN
jgi:N-acetylmuramoyl-L-alanine amidase